ncbi:MAG: energy-coupling factor transporter ATPase [Eubacterium sp.]|nr:energy-coupling factor transporter ATPase [Eubacterium sp.]
MELLLNNVSYIYEEGTAYEKHALFGVDLSIKQGEFIGLIGKTGSGKSTLVKTFNGLLKPSYGGVYVDGEDIHEKDYKLYKLRGRVGMVFQYPEDQLFEKSVIEDVKFGPSNQDIRELDVEYRAFMALKQVGIGQELLDVSPLDLSGGQKRRVAIAGVLAMEPEVLILDEPTAGLDAEGRRNILEIINDLNKTKNTTVILISHRMEDIAEYATRVIAMDAGKIVADGRPEDVFSDTVTLEKYGLKAPEITYIVRDLARIGVKVKHGAITVDQAVKAIL